jgi:hypothetical protein
VSFALVACDEDHADEVNVSAPARSAAEHGGMAAPAPWARLRASGTPERRGALGAPREPGSIAGRACFDREWFNAHQHPRESASLAVPSGN